MRRLAKEHNIDLQDVVGTGPQNRILKEDLLEHIRYESSKPTPSIATVEEAEAVVAATPKPGTSYLAQDTITPLSRK